MFYFAPSWMRLLELVSTCFRLFSCCFRSCLDCFGLFRFLFKFFKFVLVCVVSVQGCVWPSWLFYVAYGVRCKLGCFKLFQIVFAV